MALFDTLKEAFLQNPPELEKPHFYKASSDSRDRLEFLREFWWTVSDAERPQLEREIVMLLDSIEGEKCIEKALAESDLPVVVLHDLHFRSGDLMTRIDYLVITAKFILIIEGKNLIGHIEVDQEGRFFRTYTYEGESTREEIASPIAENAANLEVIRQLRSAGASSEIWRLAFERNFAQNYLSVVVAANPNTTLDLRHADLEVKSQIIRADQLADHIRGLLDTMRRDLMPEKHMYSLAYSFLQLHRQTTAGPT